MTTELHEAHNLKYEPGGLVWLRQLSTGNFALYRGGNGKPFWIGPIEELGTAYAKRPGPTPPAKLYQPSPIIRGINLSTLEINI